MLALDKETFSYYVTHPEDLTATDFVQAQESVLAYPYCQSLHTLVAKAASVHQRGQAVPYVRQAAAHALSRNALRKLIDSEFQWSENLLSKLNELSAKHVPIPDDYQQESYTLFKERAGLSERFPWLTLLQLPAPETPEPILVSSQASSTPEVKTESVIEASLQPEPVQAEELVPSTPPPPSPADLKRQRQMELIESFIKNEPRIASVRADINEVAAQADLTKRAKHAGGSLVTESFAKILEKQGKFDKAREVYEKLMVKNPEKKAYFAAKIDEIADK